MSVLPISLSVSMSEDISDGTPAAIVRIDGERVTLDASVAAAPGARLTATIDDDRTLRIKVHRCRRTGARFQIDGRVFDMTRELRNFLVERLKSGIS